MFLFGWDTAELGGGVGFILWISLGCWSAQAVALVCAGDSPSAALWARPESPLTWFPVWGQPSRSGQGLALCLALPDHRPDPQARFLAVREGRYPPSRNLGRDQRHSG
jgi:hypothetical protein